MSDLFRSPDAIVVLNDDETYTNVNGCHVYLLHGDISANDYDVSNFARDVVDHPDVQVLSIERLVEFYLAFEAMNAHAFNVNKLAYKCSDPTVSPTDVGGIPLLPDDEEDDSDDDPYNFDDGVW